MRSHRQESVGWFAATFAVVLILLIAAASFLMAQNYYASGSYTSQNARREGSWLDRPMANWNDKSRELPTPTLPADNEELKTRCPNLLRETYGSYEGKIVQAGWLMYGAVQSYGSTTVVTALSGADGSCQPLGYQAFVYVDRAYVGTLSPELMNSATNGALTHIRLMSPVSISGEFARYRESDSSCCPTRISYVTFEVSGGDAPIVSPVEIVTRSLCPPNTGVPEKGLNDAARLFEVRWTLTQMGGATVTSNNPYLKFERAAKIFSGNGGCNQIAGGFEIDGTSLSFKAAVKTNFACLDVDADKLEANLMKALNRITRFEIEDDTLRLYDCSDLLLVFQADRSQPH